MNLRLANMSDLPQLKQMYRKIIDNMYKDNIKIWDEFYPCEIFQYDIQNNRLYVLINNSDIVAAVAMCDSNDGEDHVKWKGKNQSALYMDRLGVNINYLRQGIGKIMIENAIELAKKKNIKYLRLFVVDINEPAIKLYLKNGFRKVDGVYEEKIDNNCILREYGFEIEVTK